MDGFIQLFGEYDIPGAFLVNIELTLWSALFSMILGVVLVMMRISPISSLRAVAGAYVELFKNLPLTIIMVFMVLGAYAQLKLSFSDTFAVNFFWLAVTGLSLYTAAFVCESLRSGINTVPLGQAEAARALGLGFMQSATEIILPQATSWAISCRASRNGTRGTPACMMCSRRQKRSSTLPDAASPTPSRSRLCCRRTIRTVAIPRGTTSRWESSRTGWAPGRR